MLHKHLPSAEEAKYYRSVVDVLNYHSLLDLNIGLCISHLKYPEDPTKAHKMLGRVSCGAKIEELNKLLQPGDMKLSFEEWACRSPEIRALRNSFAHGVWEYLPLRKTTPVGLKIAAWEPFRDGVQHEMSVSELEDIAQEVHDYFQDFMAWRKSYGV